jgi:hypothetical protein
MAREFTLRCAKCGTRIKPGQASCHECAADLSSTDAIHNERDEWKLEYEKGFVQYVLFDPLIIHLFMGGTGVAYALWLHGWKIDPIHEAIRFASLFFASLVVQSIRWSGLEKEFEDEPNQRSE